MLRSVVPLFALAVVLLTGCSGKLGGEITPRVEIDSQVHPTVVEIDYRGSKIAGLGLAAPSTLSFGPTDQFEFYLGNSTFRPEPGQSGYSIPREELPRDGQVRPAGYRLYNQEGQLIAQDEVKVRLIF